MEYTNIGGVKIEKTAALAPMASVADRAYRIMAKEYGACYVVGEMASCKGLCYNDRKTAELLSVTPGERPMAVQLFGNEPEFVKGAVEIAERFQPDIIDINSGCPMPKIVSGGAGSALMKTPELFGDVVRAAVEAAHVPVTVKIRAGWDENSINAVEIAKIAEQSGAAAVAVHGRTKTQLYAGKADWDVIRAVKQSVSIPVIGNGDVKCVQDAVRMVNETGCDMVMIGRGALGNPWIFREINGYFSSGLRIMPPPTLAERIVVIKKHMDALCAAKGEGRGMREARKHVAWYMHGLRGAAEFRRMAGELETLSDLDKLLEKVYIENKDVSFDP